MGTECLLWWMKESLWFLGWRTQGFLCPTIDCHFFLGGIGHIGIWDRSHTHSTLMLTIFRLVHYYFLTCLTRISRLVTLHKDYDGKSFLLFSNLRVELSSDVCTLSLYISISQAFLSPVAIECHTGADVFFREQVWNWSLYLFHFIF